MNDSKEKVLIDKGWKEMAIILDKEMPLGNSTKSNFGMVVALLLLLLFLGIGGGYYMINSSKSHLNKKTIEKKKSIASKNSFADIAANSSSNPNEKYNSIYNNNTNTIDQVSKDKSIGSENKKVSEVLKNQTLVISSSGNISNSAISKRDDSSISTKGLVKHENTLPIDKLDKKLLMVNKLDNLSMEVSGDDFVLLYTKKITPVLLRFKHKKHFSKAFSLGSAIVSENLTKFGGVESGAEFELGLTKKIGLTAGIDFSFFRKKGMQNSFLTNIFNVRPYDGRYEDDKIPERNKLSPRYKEAFNISTRNPYTLGGFVDELYYVGLPIGIYYKIKNLRLSIGFKASYLLYGTNFTSKKNYVGGQNYIISSDKAFINSKVYNRFDYSSFIVFDLRVYKRTSLSAKFNYSFTNILSNPETQLKNVSHSLFALRINDQYINRYDNNIYFSLGLKYSLL